MKKCFIKFSAVITAVLMLFSTAAGAGIAYADEPDEQAREAAAFVIGSGGAAVPREVEELVEAAALEADPGIDKTSADLNISDIKIETVESGDYKATVSFSITKAENKPDQVTLFVYDITDYANVDKESEDTYKWTFSENADKLIIFDQMEVAADAGDTLKFEFMIDKALADHIMVAKIGGANIAAAEAVQAATFDAKSAAIATPTPTPTEEPTPTPTDEPSAPPTDEPSAPPTDEPSAPPTDEPSAPPKDEPSAPPTDEPSTPPKDEPSAPPTDEPSAPPTDAPTAPPTDEPSAPPTDAPTAKPSTPQTTSDPEIDKESGDFEITDINVTKDPAGDYKVKVSYKINAEQMPDRVSLFVYDITDVGGVDKDDEDTWKFDTDSVGSIVIFDQTDVTEEMRGGASFEFMIDRSLKDHIMIVRVGGVGTADAKSFIVSEPETPPTEPSESPTTEPSDAPTSEPSESPTSEPSESPTSEPSEAPTNAPTGPPTSAPTPTSSVTTPTAPPPTAEPQNTSDPGIDKESDDFEITDINVTKVPSNDYNVKVSFKINAKPMPDRVTLFVYDITDVEGVDKNNESTWKFDTDKAGNIVIFDQMDVTEDMADGAVFEFMIDASHKDHIMIVRVGGAGTADAKSFVVSEFAAVPTATPGPGTPTATPGPGTPTATPGADTPTATPGPGTPTATPGPGTPTATPGPGTPTATPGGSVPTATPQPLPPQNFDGDAPKDVVVTLPNTGAAVTGVTLNGNPVPKEYYKIENGVITFTPEFLESLPNGEHEIVIETSDGTASNSYSVNIEVSNTFEPATPTPAPTPTRKPSISGGGGGGGSGGGGRRYDLGFGTNATPAPSATAKPDSADGPAATAAPGGDTPISGEAQVFEDVPADHWAYSYIMSLYNAGIINGETPTLFVPDDGITRAEFTKIAVLMFGLTPDGTSTFADVPADEWYAPYIAAAQAAAIINGTSETTFSPDEYISREQIAAIVGRYLGMSSDAPLSYTDAAEIEPYALPYVSALTQAGILTGDNGYFMPKSSATRAEAAAIMSRTRILD